MDFSIEGKLYKILDEQVVNDKFRKREFVLEIADGNYPQIVKFQLVQDKVTLLDRFKPGDQIKVNFDLSGREYNSPKGEVMYFTNLSAWRIEPAGQSSPATSSVPSNDTPLPDAPSFESTSNGADDLDDLPF